MTKFKVGDCVRATALAEYLSVSPTSPEYLIAGDIGWVIEVNEKAVMYPYTVRWVRVGLELLMSENEIEKVV